ncbi:Uncharacterised protein [Bordetella pertussis]|nr:Uncharacterised protein [Bordetella pertussis]CFO65255.1 Uncharacterised protein [Bordetella pertussis]CFU79480.1 Uncharacterised protein [Bordetella pertussis]CPK69774.1 Uncharacterised protein [Bordetella pertussis]CPL66866.1 Uncharacterised protein [Bordetella pertussis]
MSGRAFRMSSSLRAATVVDSFSGPTPKSACVVIWTSRSVAMKATLLPSLRIRMFARMGRVWRLSTMPATVDSGFSNASRVVCTSCMVILLEFVPTRAGYG